MLSGLIAVKRPSADLRRDFPDMAGLSARNLKYVRALVETHPDRAFAQQVVARLPWGTSSGLWRASRTVRAANCTRDRRLNTVGAATSLSTKSRATI
jgi:DUF1016 N-terminal domain